MVRRNQKSQELDQGAALKIASEFISFLKKKKYNIKQAYLFGSYVSGKFNENSDIDLAIVMSNVSNSFLMQMELMKVSWRFDSRIEPHPFDATDFDRQHPMAREILRTGIRVE